MTDKTQEPVAWMDAEGDVYKTEPPEGWCPPHVPLYTSPQPSKPWVGLTDGEFTKIKASLSRHEGWDGDAWDFALKEAIEAKLREKNA